jgi:hypothetical protein
VHGPSPSAKIPLGVRQHLYQRVRSTISFARRLSRVTDVGGDVAERLLARQRREDAFAVVTDDEAKLALDTLAAHRDVLGSRVERVLHELRDGLARVGLATREPAYELEGVGRFEL